MVAKKEFATKRKFGLHIFVCIEVTRNELVNYCHSEFSADVSNRCHVTLEGVEDCFFEEVDPAIVDRFKSDLPDKPFLLLVGK